MKFIERNRKFYYNNLNSNNHHLLKTQKDNYFDGDERNIKTTSVKIRINSQKKKIKTITKIYLKQIVQ